MVAMRGEKPWNRWRARLWRTGVWFAALVGLVASSSGQELDPQIVENVDELYYGAYDVAISKGGVAHCVFAEWVTKEGGLRQLRVNHGERQFPDGDWTVRRVTDLTTDYLRLSLAINGDGFPAIAYLNGGGLWVTSKIGGGTWEAEPSLESFSDKGPLNGLDLHYVPQLDSLAIAYTRGDGSLGLATGTRLNWEIRTIGPTGYQPSMIPPAGLFGLGKVAVYEPVAGDLLIVEQKIEGFPPVATWETRPVSTINDSGRNPSMRKLAGGGVGIAFQRRNGTTHSCHYAETSFDLFSVTPIDAGEADFQKGGGLALSLDSIGQPQVVYSVNQISTGAKSYVFARRHPGFGWQKTPFGSLAAGDYGGLACESNDAGEPIAIDLAANRVRALVQCAPSWAISTPQDALPEPFDQLYLPAVAAAADGTPRVAFIGQNTGSVFRRIHYGRGRGGVYGVAQIASSPVPPSDLKIVLTRDGRELLYILNFQGVVEYEIGSDGLLSAGMIPDSSSPETGANTFDAAAAPDGTVHVCFVRGGTFRHARKKPGEAWEYVSYGNSPAPGTKAVAIGISGSIVRISAWSETGEITLATAGPGSSGSVSSLGSVPEEPANSAIIDSRIGRRILWASGGKLWFSFGFPNLEPIELGDVSTPAVVAAANHTVEEIELTYFSYPAGGSAVLGSGIFYPNFDRYDPKGIMILPTPSNGTPKIELVIDQFGQPFAALGFGGAVDDGLFLISSDALDLDGDGIPSLHEDAYCLDSLADPAAELPYWSRMAYDESGELTIRGNFRAPSGSSEFHPEGRGVQVNEFDYGFCVSSDLNDWSGLDLFLELHPTVTGLTSDFDDRIGVSDGVKNYYFNVMATESARATLGRFFVKPSVKRVRPR